MVKRKPVMSKRFFRRLNLKVLDRAIASEFLHPSSLSTNRRIEIVAQRLGISKASVLGRLTNIMKQDLLVRFKVSKGVGHGGKRKPVPAIAFEIIERAFAENPSIKPVEIQKLLEKQGRGLVVSIDTLYKILKGSSGLIRKGRTLLALYNEMRKNPGKTAAFYASVLGMSEGTISRLRKEAFLLRAQAAREGKGFEEILNAKYGIFE